MDEEHAGHPGDRAESLGDVTPDGTFSAGEGGTAGADTNAPDGRINVVVGEIPDPEDLAHMLWTAECDCADHGLLGTFEERAQAEECRERHLSREHGRN
jgi:hypothetical protein